jgi:hypothetical protein
MKKNGRTTRHFSGREKACVNARNSPLVLVRRCSEENRAGQKGVASFSACIDATRLYVVLGEAPNAGGEVLVARVESAVNARGDKPYARVHVQGSVLRGEETTDRVKKEIRRACD